jgi:septation ring formation regulator EzrA
MNRASDRETRLAALEGQVHDILRHLEVILARQDDTAKELARMRDIQAHTARSTLKLNRELSAQREKYPLG